MKHAKVLLLLFVLCSLFSSSKALAATYLDNPTIDSDTTFYASASPYVISGDIFVASGTTLTIEPGTVIKFDFGSSIGVFGKLVVGGTGATTTLTSLYDDSVSGDTNLDGTSEGSVGDWGGIYVGPGGEYQFSNVAYKYSLKYPKSAAYSFSLGDATDSKIVRFQLEKSLGVDYKLVGSDVPKDETRFSFIVDSSKNTKNVTLDEWIQSEISRRQAPKPILQKKINVSGEEAYYLEYSSSSSGSFGVTPFNLVAVYVIHGGLQYRISGIKTPDNAQNDPAFKYISRYEAFFNSMLNSFDFQ